MNEIYQLLGVQAKPLKNFTCGGMGILSSIIIYFFGGWSQGMATLITFMTFDYVTGLIVAAVFKKSSKTKKGGLNSTAGYKGLWKKVGILIAVACLHHIDLVLGKDILMNAGIIGFIANEFISIIENLGRMGIKFPPVVTKAIELLNNESNEKGGNENG